MTASSPSLFRQTLPSGTLRSLLVPARASRRTCVQTHSLPVADAFLQLGKLSDTLVKTPYLALALPCRTFIWALVTAMVGRMSTFCCQQGMCRLKKGSASLPFSFSMMSLNRNGAR